MTDPWTLTIIRNETTGPIDPCKYDWTLSLDGRRVDNGYAFSRWTARRAATRARRRWIKNSVRDGDRSYFFHDYQGRWIRKDG